MHLPLAALIALVVTPGAVLAHALLIDSAWGFIASWVNEIIKQDGLPKPVNTIIADAVLVVAAFVRALMSVPKGSTYPTWGAFFTALIFIALPALTNYVGLIKPLIGNRLQTATTVIGRSDAAPPAR